MEKMLNYTERCTWKKHKIYTERCTRFKIINNVYKMYGNGIES